MQLKGNRPRGARMPSRRTLVRSSSAWVLLNAAGLAQTRDWPQRPVRILLPFAPGGNSDLIIRVLTERLGRAFGQQLLIEARPGAAGALAAADVARAAP